MADLDHKRFSFKRIEGIPDAVGCSVCGLLEDGWKEFPFCGGCMTSYFRTREEAEAHIEVHHKGPEIPAEEVLKDGLAKKIGEDIDDHTLGQAKEAGRAILDLAATIVRTLDAGIEGDRIRVLVDEAIKGHKLRIEFRAGLEAAQARTPRSEDED